MFIDAHNHLQAPELLVHFGEIYAESKRLDIGLMLVNGTSETDWSKVVELHEIYPQWVLPSLGLHPWYLNWRTPDWDKQLTYLLNKYPAAVGECGLDKWMPNFDLDLQVEILVRHLEIAHKHQRPVSLHCLKAWGSLLKVLENNPLPKRGFLLHAYSGPLEMIERLTQLGAYFSFNGYFLEARKADRLEALRRFPIERLLIETDAPAMPLPEAASRFDLGIDNDGKRINHPANLTVVYQAAAMTLGLPSAELQAQVEANFRTFMGPLIT